MASPLLRLDPILNELAGCLCASLTKDTCFCGVVAGAVVVNDYLSDCENKDGMAYVRLANVYPSTSTGEQNTEVRNMRYGIGFDIELGIQRALIYDPDDMTSSATDHAEMVTQQNADIRALFKAIHCCDSLKDIDVIVGNWVPVGPQGLVYGGTLTVFGFMP